MLIYLDIFEHHKPMRTLSLFVFAIETIVAFFNINSIHRSNLNLRTKLKMNYLDQIGNNSAYNKTKYYLAPKPVFVRKPIPKITFDEMFVRIFTTEQIYMSSNADRIIIAGNGMKGVYYMNFESDKEKITYILSLLDIDVQIVNDYPTKMEKPSGELYCDPNQGIVSIDDINRYLDNQFSKDHDNLDEEIE